MTDDHLAGSAEVFAATFTSLVEWLLDWWIAGHDPGLALVRNAVLQLWPVMRWLSAAVLAGSLVCAAVVIMLRRRGSDLAQLAIGVGRFLLVVAGGWLLIASSWVLCDALADWLLGGSVKASSYGRDLADALGRTEPVLSLTLSVAGIAACLVLVAVIVARFVLAVVFTAVLPVASAASLAAGRASFSRLTGWLIAVLVFRPLAFLVVRAGLHMHSQTRESVVLVIVCLVTLVLAASVLPMTARIVQGRA